MARERESVARNSARDVARRRAQESSHGGGRISLPDGVDFFKNDGKTVEFDFIPYKVSSAFNPDVRADRIQVGDYVDALMYKQHQDIGAGQDKYICPTSIGKPCPICEAYAEARKKGTMSKDELKALKPKERMLYNVIDVNDKAGKVMVWDISYHLFTRQLEHEQEERNEYYEYWYPDGGHTLRIRFEKKSIDRGEPFYEADRIDFTARKGLSDDDLAQAVDLDAVLQVLSYEKLEAVFLGVDAEPAPAAEERPARSTAVPTTTAAVESRRRGRSSESAPAPVPERTTRGHREDTIHDKAPDAPAERARATTGRHAVDPDQDCPGGGTFGVSTDELDACRDCDEVKWNACRDEKDRLAKLEKEKPVEKNPTPPARRGRR